MSAFLGVLGVIVAFVVIMIPIVMFKEICEMIFALIVRFYPFMGLSPVLPFLGLFMILVLITILVGIVDMILCRQRFRKDDYQKMRSENRKLGRSLEELRNKEQKLLHTEEACRQQTAQAFAEHREILERNVVFHEQMLHRNRLCTLLVRMGEKQAEKLIVRVDGKDICKQEEKLLADYAELKSRYTRV